MAQSLTRSISRMVGLVSNNYVKTLFPNTSKVCHNSEISLQNPISTTCRRWKTTVCWKCGAERYDTSRSSVFCQKCNVVQPPKDDGNYFTLFDLEEKFEIDQQLLRNKFRQLQSVLHPDKFSNRPDEEQAISAEYSSLLNKAYSSLNVPLKRAEHLLKLRGEAIGESQSVDDPDFLIEIMTLNEEVEETGKNIKKLKNLNLRNKEKIETMCRIIDGCFKTNNIQNAKEAIIRLKYFASLSNRINAALRELGETD